ncbi:CaiB/BaiF CoA transferase family protein [Chloroflexota bacterium]
MPLTGTRVIEWASRMQGPVAGQILGALGADVIKIEQPGIGDSTRGSVRFFGVSQVLADGSTAHYEGHNRNKRSITLNLRKPAAREIVYRLVEKSDVFLHNQRKGVAERMGLDYDTLSRLNPRIIYTQGWGLGPEGPESGVPALDSIAQARSGTMLPYAKVDVEPYQRVPGMVDEASAQMLAFGTVTALYAREKLGVGQRVDGSLFGSAIRQIRQLVADYYITGLEGPQPPRDKMPNPLYNEYRCKDGRWIILALYQPDRYWDDFCRVIGMPELRDDARFSDRMKREENCGELCSILTDLFATRTYEEWERLLREGGDFIFGPVKSIKDLADDPQVIENRYLADFEDPVYGRIKVPGLPLDFSKTPWAIRRRAPGLGEHTEEILLEILGNSWEQISELKEEGVI